MAKKISQLAQATQVKSDDVTVIVQDGETKKLPLNMMLTKQDVENKKIAGLAKLDEIEATYENDTYTPTITVKNKSSVKVGEGDGVDYSANVVDGHAKSAILKGQTLVNLVKPHKALETYYKVGISTSYQQKIISLIRPLEPNKTYTLQMNITETNGNVAFQSIVIGKGSSSGDAWSHRLYPTDFTNQTKNVGITKCVFTTTSYISETNLSHIIIISEHYDIDATIEKIMIVEGDYTNADIPYFTDMQSVKMPVLTTTGKNLFNKINIERGAYLAEADGKEITVFSENAFYQHDYIRIKSNTNYILSSTTEPVRIHFYDKDKNYVKRLTNVNIGSMTSFTTENFTYIRLSCGINDLDNIQLEEATSATPYEPYKTNILSTSDDVTLRGVGGVKDTLDCLTGEVVERIGEIVLDGSNNITYKYFVNDLENTIRFAIADSTIKNAKNETDSNNAKSDKLLYTRDSYSNDIEGFFVSNNNNTIYIRLNKSKLITNDIDGVKAYLKTNPIKIQYQLATESIKTVDLIPSGTHPSTTPYCWKDGHIQLSSSGLLPSLEYSVVTSRAGQISQNAAMIVKNDKRIFDLEILLAGGLVNTTYQALTLQNQVETGLSKVSLSSEKEPDYLLYHMIMKLIEEKAYKLDDLAEKVSVFYLYEKLSDEQFETIYSELYPFVEEEYIELPEDGEIIEEPIVDEVLEEVENEVVM